MSETAEKKRWYERIKMPHTYVILITIMIAMTLLYRERWS